MGSLLQHLWLLYFKNLIVFSQSPRGTPTREDVLQTCKAGQFLSIFVNQFSNHLLKQNAKLRRERRLEFEVLLTHFCSTCRTFLVNSRCPSFSRRLNHLHQIHSWSSSAVVLRIQTKNPHFPLLHLYFHSSWHSFLTNVPPSAPTCYTSAPLSHSS